MSTKSNCMDLKITQEDFCTLWGCDRYETETLCTYCPFIKDVLDMAQEQSMGIPAWSCMAIAKRY
jgi:Zn-finger protein